MHKVKFANVIGMNAEHRLKYFLRKVADFEQVWGLYNHGWAMAAGDDGRPGLPVWPERGFADACATGPWRDHAPTAIPLGDFLEKVRPRLESDKMSVIVFPTPADQGVFVEPAVLSAAIEAECQQYEG